MMEESGLSKTEIVNRLVDVIEKEVVPLTDVAVRNGNKLFGAAILRKSDLSFVVAGTNTETECPLWHGEVASIRNFWSLPAAKRPPPSDCIMLATHEPCSMCISAITWSAFPETYHLFSMERTRDAFNIPHDLKIYKEVFGCERATRTNEFFTAYDIYELVDSLPVSDKETCSKRLESMENIYAELSLLYQDSKTTRGPHSGIQRP
ncbi:unnamed protein product [Discosporangium mesarthrocarpum]